MKFLKRLIFSLIPAILIFSFFELLFTLSITVYEPEFFDVDPPFDFLVAEGWKLTEYYERDRDLFWFPRSNRAIDGIVWMNSLGFRGAEPSLNPSKERELIAFLGDSVTFGFGIAEDGGTYPYLVKSILDNRTGRDIAIVNGGIPGYTSLQGLRLYRKKIREMRPSCVTLLFGLNDFNQAYRLSDSEIRFSGELIKRVWNLLKGFRSYRIMRAGLLNMVKTTPRVKERVPLPEYIENMRRLVQEIREDGALPILLTNAIRSGMPLVIDPYPYVTSGRRKRRVHYIPQFYLCGVNLMTATPEEVGMEELKMGIEAHPDWPIYHYIMAQKYERAGNIEEAEREYHLSRTFDRGREKVREMNRAIRNMAGEYGIPLVDLEKVFEKGDGARLFLDGMHPSPLGHRLIAKEVSEKVFPCIE